MQDIIRQIILFLNMNIIVRIAVYGFIIERP